MSLTEYTLLAFSSLFVVVDPIAVVPAFIAMTPNDSPAARSRMARLACLVAAGVLMLFALTGQWIFKLLGITLPAFQIAGSLLLLRMALDMLYAKRSAAQETREEVEAGAAKEDVAITPLGVPMLAGPGAISTSLILLSQARGVAQHIALFASILVVCGASYWIFWLAARGARRFSPLALKLVTRLMGLLLAAVSVQFALNGLAQTPLFTK
ncbi:MAG TPA: MarC family protein [Candidatus Eisenbacteria bacterium]|jgi:multiple antibiotic resistance protein|nr:MarC family protein [Candidatus Eisenbacteria bacterium]